MQQVWFCRMCWLLDVVRGWRRVKPCPQAHERRAPGCRVPHRRAGAGGGPGDVLHHGLPPAAAHRGVPPVSPSGLAPSTAGRFTGSAAACGIPQRCMAGLAAHRLPLLTAMSCSSAFFLLATARVVQGGHGSVHACMQTSVSWPMSPRLMLPVSSSFGNVRYLM